VTHPMKKGFETQKWLERVKIGGKESKEPNHEWKRMFTMTSINVVVSQPHL